MEEEKDGAKPVLGLFGSSAESLLRMEIAQLQHEKGDRMLNSTQN